MTHICKNAAVAGRARGSWTIALALGLIFFAGAARGQDESKLKIKQLTAVWNGADLQGWKTFFDDPTVDAQSIWSVADGALKLDAGKHKGYLYTETAYANYHLHAEWRWPKDAAPKANSGILLHLQGENKIWPACYQFQLKANDAGQLLGMELDIPAAPLVNYQKRADKLEKPSEKPFGEWNTCEIYCRADSIEVFVNNVRQNKVERLQSGKGAIGLQLEGHPIEFKNIWLEPGI